MRVSRMIPAVLIGVALVATACGQQAAPAPTSAPAAAPTKPAAAPTTAATAAPTKPAAAPAAATQSPAGTAVPTKPAAVATSVPTPSPAATPAAGGGTSLVDIMTRARANAEYSYDFSVTEGGKTVNGKAFLKATKMRQEMAVDGQNAVILVDSAAKTAHMIIPDQKIAMKVDYAQYASQNRQPDSDGGLPASSRITGPETVDGKPAMVVEVTEGSGQGKYWYWTERGVPLKVETTGPQGRSTMLYTNYQFAPQPDSLFQIPAGVQVMELPAGMPGAPGGPGLPGNMPVPPTR